MNNLRFDKINDNISLHQIRDGLLFGTDALMLSYFLAEKIRPHTKKAVEFGTGSGVISLLLAVKTDIEIIHAVEIQPVYVQLALKNVEYNNLLNRIRVIAGDLKKPDTLGIEPESVEVVFTNPPYMRTDTGVHSEISYKNIAKHEIECDIYDVLASAYRLLKERGDFYCVYRTERLTALFDAMRRNSIEPKIMRFIHATPHSQAGLVLVKGKKNAGEGLVVEPAAACSS